MPNPYKIYDRNQGPPWLKQLDKYIEKPDNQAEKKTDAVVAQRNHGGDGKQRELASYGKFKNGKK